MDSGVWSTVQLKGDVQIIPNVCPNCLKDAGNDLRYAYMKPWSLINPTSYFQTFRYCDACIGAATADVNHRERSYWLTRFQGLVAAVVLGLLVMAALSVLVPQDLDKETQKEIRFLLYGVGVVLSYAGLWMCKFLFKSRLKTRYPKRPDQAVWGVAAFYTGSSLLDIFNSRKVYAAARREWLANLVSLNPTQVDDATYQEYVGNPKPAGDTVRPFAA